MPNTRRKAFDALFKLKAIDLVIEVQMVQLINLIIIR